MFTPYIDADGNTRWADHAAVPADPGAANPAVATPSDMRTRKPASVTPPSPVEEVIPGAVDGAPDDLRPTGA